jgi:hypothetical protein
MSNSTIRETIDETWVADTSICIVDAVVDVPSLPAPDTSSITPRPRQERWLHVIFHVGLAGVFLVNALVALLQPADFAQLVEKSAMSRWLHLGPGSWLVPVVGVNDLLLGLALLGAIWFRRAQPAVLAWAGSWLLAVMLIKLTSLQAFPA